jgi:S-adenosylmethionine synthetase
VTLRYVDGKPVAATAIVVSTQHAPGYDEGAKGAELQAYVKKTVTGLLPEGFVSDATAGTSTPPAASRSAAPMATPA